MDEKHSEGRTAEEAVQAGQKALARLHGEPVYTLPLSLYIPPDALEVFLESFEGPLDFLLYLIRRQKFDILDIPVAELTEQYLYYVDQIKDSDIEQVGEYLLMAAYLVEIKTKSLLPKEVDENGEEVDPRAEIIRQLVERDKLQKAAGYLDGLPQLGRDFEVASVVEEAVKTVDEPEVTAAMLAEAWRQVLAYASTKVSHKITRQELKEREVMVHILNILKTRRLITFTELLSEAESLQECVVMFISLLEMQKARLVRITQSAPFTPIYLEAAEPPEPTASQVTLPL